MSEYKSEVRDGMRIDWDVPIRMDDGLVLRADVFRPVKEGKYPAIVSYEEPQGQTTVLSGPLFAAEQSQPGRGEAVTR